MENIESTWGNNHKLVYESSAIPRRGEILVIKKRKFKVTRVTYDLFSDDPMIYIRTKEQ